MGSYKGSAQFTYSSNQRAQRRYCKGFMDAISFYKKKAEEKKSKKEVKPQAKI